MKRVIVGGMIGFNINDNSKKFMNVWIKHINNIPLLSKGKGYGQLSLYYAYKDEKDSVKIGLFPDISMRNNRNYQNNNETILISGNKGKKLSIINRLYKTYKT